MLSVEALNIVCICVAIAVARTFDFVFQLLSIYLPTFLLYFATFGTLYEKCKGWVSFLDGALPLLICYKKQFFYPYNQITRI